MEERRMTPLMGWASWNCFRTNINEERLKVQADCLVSTGLAECGYTYFNVDDGFFGGRGEDGRLNFHPDRFPNGIRVIADYAHSLGLKAGIYTDAGDNTCGHYYDNEKENGLNVGCYGHEEEDLRQLLVENDFDFLKVDWCGGLRLNLDEEEQYTKIYNVIEKIRKETGKPIIYNICRWEFPGEWATKIADSWRTGLDIAPCFDSVLYQIDNMKPLARFCRPGHVNDSDMMQIGTGMTREEEKTHFAMWCMLSTPLMIGGDLTKISEETLKILKNKELIAINQDAACRQAVVVKEYKTDDKLMAEVWVKKLTVPESDDERAKCKMAVAFLNRSEKEMYMDIDLKEAGLGGEILSIRDICQGKDIKPTDKISTMVLPHGVSVYLVTSTAVCEYRDCNAHLKTGREKFERISGEKLKELLLNGGILVDVRTFAEYEKGHMEGAVNIPYADIYLKSDKVLPDKNRPVIVYCATGKRSYMAKERLDHMGYKEVYFLGEMKQMK